MADVLANASQAWTGINTELEAVGQRPSPTRDMLMVRTLIRNFSRVGEVINLTLTQVQQAVRAIDRPGWRVVHVSIIC